jgi:hypothetical protein
MILDASTIIPLGVAVPVAVWLGRVVIKAAQAATNLSRDIEALRTDLHRLTNEKLDREDFIHWVERLGDKNKTLDLPSVHRYDEAA